jgi:hypothetical protein
MRLVLKSVEGETVDARFLYEGEKIEVNSEIEFPCHKAMIECRLFPVQQLVASMPQRVLNSAPGWWLYRSPVEVGQDAMVTKSSIKMQIQKEMMQVSIGSAVSEDFGPGLFGPSKRDKLGVSLVTSPAPTLVPQIAAAATREVMGEKERRSYKEVLLSSVKEVGVGKKKKRWKPTRRKMAHRNQERGGKDRYRREERSDRERNWDMRRDAVGGWDVERHH